MKLKKEELQYFIFTPSVWIVPTLMLLLNWFVFFGDNFFHLHLNEQGIYPRTLLGIKGIFFSPFLHGDFKHIASNTLPLFVLTFALIYFYRAISLKILFYGILLSGTITWIIGRESYHIGASGLIYVLVSFIFFKGIQTQYYRLAALSFVVVLLYGGLIWYIFPKVEDTVSWESHLAGFISGFVFSLIYKTPDYVKAIQYNWERPDFDPQEDPFMRQFDENGNFFNLPEVEEEEILEPYYFSNQAVNYVFLENKKEDAND